MTEKRFTDLASFEIWKENDIFVVYDGFSGSRRTFDSIAQMMRFIEDELEKADEESQKKGTEGNEN